MSSENIALENFINFCDEMQIAEEKVDMRILDGNFSKRMKLFHGTYRKLDIIRPMSVNMGNRLDKNMRTSSFWAKDISYAILWALDWLDANLELPYGHDIKNNKFIIPDYVSKDGKDAIDVMEETLKEFPLYVYEAEVDAKLIGRGSVPY